jgi:TetR/AcrR family transcriptional regulator, tetracycline repressor protein
MFEMGRRSSTSSRRVAAGDSDADLMPPWLARPERSRRAPRPPLDRAAVLEAASRVLDRDGARGLTMRNVAAELGVAAASLYGHVANKEELVQMVLDRVFDRLPTSYPGLSWQEQLKEFLRTVRRTFLEHPGLAELTLGRVPAGPNFLVHLESLLQILHDARLPDRIAAFTGDLLGLYVGAYVYEETMQHSAQEMGPDRLKAMSDWFASLPPDRFPRTVALATTLTSGDSDERFEWGADVLIRGLATYAES